MPADPRYGPQPELTAELVGSVVEDLMARARQVQESARAAGRIPDVDDDDGDEDPLRARRRARWSALVPPVLGDPRLTDVDDAIRADLTGWATAVLDGARTVLVIAGPIGVGKSHAAYAALRPIVGADRTVAGGQVAGLLDQLRGSYDGHGGRGLDDLVRADVCILDDLAGDEKPTDWAVERLALLIHRRHAACRPMVITTNLPGGDLRAHLEPYIGERAVSRLADDHLVIRLTGADRRRTTP